MNLKLVSVFLCLCLLGYLSPNASAASVPNSTETFEFEPSWGLDASETFSGNLGALGVGVSVSFSYAFDAGVSLPVMLTVTHPQYLPTDSSALLNISAEGLSNGRAWAYASGGVSASIDAGLAGSFSLVDRSINLGDEVTFTTPLGDQETTLVEADMALGSHTLDLLLISYTFELRIRMTAAVVTSTRLTSALDMTGPALSSPVQESLSWSDEEDVQAVGVSVGQESGTYIDLSFDNVVMHLDRLSFVIQSFMFYLVVNGDNMGGITIPLPPLGLNILSEEESSGYMVPLADASGSTRDLGPVNLSIYVGVPLLTPAFLSPGFLMMVIPSIGSVIYGRKSEKGSKGLAIVLGLIVLAGAAVLAGFDFLESGSFITMIAGWTAAIFQEIQIGQGLGAFFFSILPWVLAGVAVGGACKRPKSGFLIAFVIPFAFYLITTFLVGGALPSIYEVAYPAIIAASFAAMGAAVAGSREDDW